MAASLNFKVFLEVGGSQQEVRRFTVYQPPQLELVMFRERLSIVFPHLGAREHVLMWEDREGDRISIDCDEELRFCVYLIHRFSSVYFLNASSA